MISFTVRMRFRPEDHTEIAEALRELTTHSRQEPGCVTYVAHFVAEKPNTVFIYEQYRDRAAVEAHRATEHFARLASGVLYGRMLDRQVEDLDALS